MNLIANNKIDKLNQSKRDGKNRSMLKNRIKSNTFQFILPSSICFQHSINTNRHIYSARTQGIKLFTICTGIVCISKYDEVVAIYYNPPVQDVKYGIFRSTIELNPKKQQQQNEIPMNEEEEEVENRQQKCENKTMAINIYWLYPE